MTTTRIAPYGSWKSPITSSLIVAQTIGLSEVRLDGGDVWWLELRPQDNGRCVVVHRPAGGGAARDVTPLPFSARTRMHEYGGGAWTVAAETLIFSNDQARPDGQPPDRRLYRQEPGATPVPVTLDGPWRYADGAIDGLRRRWIGVREDHSVKPYPDNAVVAVDLNRPRSDAIILARGHDFFSSPRLSPDGRRLAWLAWDHPNMPWVGTTLFVAELGDDGMPLAPRPVAGGPAESIFQPEWSPDGSALTFVSDRTGWWNLYSVDPGTGMARPLAPMAAECGQPQWVFGMATYAFAGRDRIVVAYSAAGLGRLAVIALESGQLTDLDLPFSAFSSVRTDGGDRVVFIGAAPDRPASVVELDLGSGAHKVLKQSADVADDPAIRKYFTAVAPVEFPTEGGKTAFGLFYPPFNPDHAAPPGDTPPLVVKCHGGPTSAASSALNLGNQYWTSRGIAVLDVNYGGSTGFGREYRDRLHLAWGIVDVDDCINGAKFLSGQGRVDGNRVVITGGSAGGYTALMALTTRTFFAGGGSHYGVSDAAALARDTHKFESRYLDWLIGPYPQEEARYRERSPVEHANGVTRPMIFFQGDEDRIVPPDQTERMVDALRRRKIPVGYLLFAGEQHGFRQAGNIQRALDAELYFYAFEVFGIKLTY